MAVLMGVVWLVSSMLTGTGNQPGVIEQAERKVQAIDLRSIHQGFFVWSQDHQDKFPSTQTVPDMTDDVTHEVFRVLLEDGVLAGPQLMSPNEFVRGFDVGSAYDFGPENTSYALLDYDVDDWLRYPNWGPSMRGRFMMLSDRWIDAEEVPDSMRNLQSDEQNPGFWNVLFNDGASDTIENEPVLRGDNIFEYDARLNENDILMVHD